MNKLKFLVTSLFISILFFSPAYASGLLTVGVEGTILGKFAISQASSYGANKNYAYIEQAEGNKLQITQLNTIREKGATIQNRNAALAFQSGVGNSAALSQNGYGNFSVVTQEGIKNRATSTITGHDNYSSVYSSGVGNNAVFEIVGDNNSNGLYQFGGDNNSTIKQHGNGNVAWTSIYNQVDSQGYASNNLSGISQFGNNNTGYITQNGDGNTALIDQHDNGNYASITQDGSNNYVSVTQLNGNKSYTINQVGSNLPPVTIVQK